MSFPLTGTCNCGAVRFVVSAPFESSSYCHCTRCQRRTGTGASVNGRARSDAFAILAGEDRIRSWKPDQGAGKFFCGDCGSALFSRTPGDPE
ncbi:MAG: GFA family protein, partial [Solirubrobacteraceae bacterium]